MNLHQTPEATTPVGRVTPCAPSATTEPTDVSPVSAAGSGVPALPAATRALPARWLVSAALVLTLAGAFITRTAFARIMRNTIDPVGIVADKGRQVTLTGPIAVGPTAGERAELRVTVTQRSTGALAEGIIFFTGTGQTNQWEVTATTRGKAVFAPGPATAVAVALTSAAQAEATDAHQWLVNITLVKE